MKKDMTAALMKTKMREVSQHQLQIPKCTAWGRRRDGIL